MVRPSAARLAHLGPERVSRLHVHRDGRLVEEDELGITRDRQREAETLGLAARQVLCSAALEGRQARPGERQAEGHGMRVEPASEVDDLADGDADRQAADLEHRPDPTGFDRVPRRQAEHGDTAAVRVEESEHQPDRRRLPGPVRPEQGDRGPTRDRQVDAVEGQDLTVRARDPVEGDCRERRALSVDPDVRIGLGGDGWREGRWTVHDSSLDPAGSTRKSRPSRRRRDASGGPRP